MTTISESLDRKSTRLNSSHQIISYAVFCLKKNKRLDIAAEYRDDAPGQQARRVWPPAPPRALGRPRLPAGLAGRFYSVYFFFFFLNERPPPNFPPPPPPPPPPP